jgi:hypothetical protein
MGRKSKLFGFRVLLKQYELKLLLKGGLVPFVLSIIIFLPIYLYTHKPIIVLIEIVVDLVLSIIPSLLGFVLGGYALLIGFGNISIIAKQKANEISLYQKMSTVFSISLLMQIFLLIFAFIVKFVLKSEFGSNSQNLADSINSMVIFLLTFGLIYVTFMIKDLVINIFNFSQYQNLIINKEQVATPPIKTNSPSVGSSQTSVSKGPANEDNYLQ